MTKFAILLAASALAGTPAFAQEHDHHGMAVPAEPEQPEAEGKMDHSQMDHGAMDDGTMEHGGHAMTGALGSYPMSREASGTAWQPDTSQHGGIHLGSGDWTFMVHGQANLIYDWQEKPRGDTKTFVSGHLIAAARHPLGNGTLQFRTILSPDPLMGARGYPLLLQSGETADGDTRLVDRQHPHDLFGELSASYSLNLSPKDSLFIYAGLPGEPAFGPPVYLHRQAIAESPEAPITHHWLDSTHTSFGVVTVGWVHDNVKIEASRFNAREPDQHRFDIETGPLDSTAVRLSWNPTAELSLQGSWARLKEPEQLEPGVSQRRISASALYMRQLSENSWVAATIAYGRRSQQGVSLDAYALEGGFGWKDWTLFGRAEMTENNELIATPDEESPAYRVGKVSIGLIRDFAVADHLKFGVGGLYAFNFVPNAIKPLYGGNPNGAMAFMRLKID